MRQGLSRRRLAGLATGAAVAIAAAVLEATSTGSAGATIRTFIAAVIAVAAAGLALSLPGSTLRGAVIGTIFVAAGIFTWTFTDQPGVQVYTGNFLVGDLVGPSGHTYRQGDAFTLETQHFPDSPHHIGQAGWPSVVLNAGQTFTSTTAFQFGVARGGFSSHQRF